MKNNERFFLDLWGSAPHPAENDRRYP